MQTKLRTKIAAAALMLAPVAALVAAQPAAAQSRYDDHRYEQDRDHRDWRDQRDFRGDRQAPEIFDVSPGMGQVVDDHGLTRVSARYRDDASGVDVRSVTLKIDAADVTRWARVDGNDIRFAGDLKPGRHFAELELRDRAGNVAHRAWTFDVAGRGYHPVDPREPQVPARPWE